MMNGTTSVPKSIPRLVLDKERLVPELNNVLFVVVVVEKIYTTLLWRGSIFYFINCLYFAFLLQQERRAVLKDTDTT